jgi:hypothetical protein
MPEELLEPKIAEQARGTLTESPFQSSDFLPPAAPADPDGKRISPLKQLGIETLETRQSSTSGLPPMTLETRTDARQQSAPQQPAPRRSDVFDPDTSPVKPITPGRTDAPAKPALPRTDVSRPVEVPKPPPRSDAFDPDERPLRPADRPTERQQPAKSLDTARKELFDTARASGIDITKVDEYSKALEARAAEYRLKPEQIARTYENVSALFAAKTNATFTAAETNRLGLETLFNVAYNKAINQSSHSTCNVTTVEVYAASKEPEKYSDLVKQVALTGEWRSAGGVVHPPAESLKKGRDELAFNLNSPFEDNRNFTSLIVQNTLINGVYELGKYQDRGPDGKPVTVKRKFLMGPAEQDLEEDPQTGMIKRVQREDRLVDEAGKPVMETEGPLAGKVKKRDPGFREMEIQAAAMLLMGHAMPFLRGPWRYSTDVQSDRASNVPTAEAIMAQRARGPISIELKTEQGKVLQTIQDAIVKDGKCFVKVQDEFAKENTGWADLSELQTAGPRRAWRVDLPMADELLRAKERGIFPIGVHTLRGAHVQTIHDVKMHEGNCWVLIDNQHGRDKDGWITLQELHSTEMYQQFAQPIRDTPGGRIKTVDASFRAPVQPRVILPRINGGAPEPYYRDSDLAPFTTIPQSLRK